MCYGLSVAHSVNKHGEGSHSLLIFPLGHPVEVAGDAGLLKAALGRWPAREQRFDVPPLRFAFAAAEKRPCASEHFEPHPLGFLLNDDNGHAEFTVRSRSGTLSSETLLEALVLTALSWTFFIGVHAACVMRDGRSVILCGDSHAGKSTLAYACTRSGWTFVSDNAVYWSAAPWDVLVSGSASLRLREGAMEIFGLADGRITPVDQGLAHSPTSPTGRFVFLQRRPGPASIQPASSDLAMQYLAQYDTRPDRVYAEDRYRALLRDGAYTLRYEDAWEAVRCLESCV